MSDKQIIVTCNNCEDLLAFSDAMTQEEAEAKRSKLVMNPFGAPSCKKCRDLEPYSDINLNHTVSIVDFDTNRVLPSSTPKPTGI